MKCWYTSVWTSVQILSTHIKLGAVGRLAIAAFLWRNGRQGWENSWVLPGQLACCAHANNKIDVQRCALHRLYYRIINTHRERYREAAETRIQFSDRRDGWGHTEVLFLVQRWRWLKEHLTRDEHHPEARFCFSGPSLVLPLLCASGISQDQCHCS